MRGKKTYNIRNIEAHMNAFQNQPVNSVPVNMTTFQPTLLLNKNMVFQNNGNNIITQQQQTHNEYINAKYGVSRYASNLVSGKMFKQL
jgi:hypothetical protein